MSMYSLKPRQLYTKMINLVLCPVALSDSLMMVSCGSKHVAILSMLYYIKNQQDGTLAVLFISHCKITLHVSDAFCVHHQEL